MESTSVAYNQCDKWYHLNCMQMVTHVYVALSNPDASCICNSCGLLNFASDLFDYTSLFSTSKSFSPPLPPAHHQAAQTNLGVSADRQLLHFHESQRRNVKKLKGLQTTVVNFQSLMCKKGQFWMVTKETNSSIVVECETRFRADEIMQNSADQIPTSGSQR